jgi:hypothetical protein
LKGGESSEVGTQPAAASVFPSNVALPPGVEALRRRGLSDEEIVQALRTGLEDPFSMESVR